MTTGTKPGLPITRRATDEQLRQWERDHDQQFLEEMEAEGRVVNGYIMPILTEDEVTQILEDTNDYDLRVEVKGDGRWTLHIPREMAFEDAELKATEIVDDLIERLGPETCQGLEFVGTFFVEPEVQIELQIVPGGSL